jgi:hypothetical protein
MKIDKIKIDKIKTRKIYIEKRMQKIKQTKGNIVKHTFFILKKEKKKKENRE